MAGVDIEGMADAMDTALAMPRDERIERWEKMIAVLRANSLDSWRRRYLEALAATAQAPRH